jgi:hypothetical protein
MRDGLESLAEDALSLIGESLCAHDVAALSATCHSMRAAQRRLIGGRMRHYWRRLYRSSESFRESSAEMSLVDLARTEAHIHGPFGACVCCLKPGPKLGARCIDCVCNESEAFVKGSPQTAPSPVKCALSHEEMAFTCVLCECSTCLSCLCNDSACSMCRHAVDLDSFTR